MVNELTESLGSITAEGKLPSSISMPKITVIENGRPVANPRIDPAPMNFIMLASILSQQIKIRKLLEKQQCEGQVFPMALEASGEPKIYSFIVHEPYRALQSVTIYNYGPDKVYLCFNDSGRELPLRNGERFEGNFSSAERRLEILRYRCDDGKSASLMLVGKY